jgi:hypothetical protein
MNNLEEVPGGINQFFSWALLPPTSAQASLKGTPLPINKQFLAVVFLFNHAEYMWPLPLC